MRHIAKRLSSAVAWFIAICLLPLQCFRLAVGLESFFFFFEGWSGAFSILLLRYKVISEGSVKNRLQMAPLMLKEATWQTLWAVLIHLGIVQSSSWLRQGFPSLLFVIMCHWLDGYDDVPYCLKQSPISELYGNEAISRLEPFSQIEEWVVSFFCFDIPPFFLSSFLDHLKRCTA